jgi:glycosyltransferase involved in cell wall biosynthesis
MITVDVIVPTFNSGGLLNESLDSVAAQTMRPQRIIVVDDGSTDDAVEPAVTDRPNITLLHQTNSGLAVACNNGVVESTAEAFIILDHDDLLAPKAIETLAVAMDANSGVQLVHGMVHEFIDDREGLPKGVRIKEQTLVARLGGCTLVRRELWDLVDGLNPTLSYGVWIDWIDRATYAGARTLNVPEVILHRRIHAKNFTGGEQEPTSYLDVARAALARKRDGSNP